MLPTWPGRLPAALLQLVLSPLRDETLDAATRAEGCSNFLGMHLPTLHGLRHLALHGLDESVKKFLRETCTVAASLPHLVSLHVVRAPSVSKDLAPL
jgi:hypothetical protein